MKINFGISCLIAIFCSGTALYAQLTISEDDGGAIPSALLYGKSEAKGLLIPGHTTSARDGIISTASSLLIFHKTTDCF